MNRPISTALLPLAIALALLPCGCATQGHLDDLGRHEVAVRVTDADEDALVASVEATYGDPEDEEAPRTRATYDFEGRVRVPLGVPQGPDTQRLCRLVVKDPAGTTLADLHHDAIRELVVASRHGVGLEVQTGAEPGDEPSVRIVGNAPDRLGAPPETRFVSIETLYADGSDILIQEDRKRTLLLLRGIASATPEYHEELLEVAEDAETLSVADVDLLIDACYYPIETLDEINAALEGSWNVERGETFRVLSENQAHAWELGEYPNGIIAASLGKVDPLGFDDAVRLLGRLYPRRAGIAEAFGAVAQRFPSLDAAQRGTLLDVALAKDATEVARDLALAAFLGGSSRDPAALIRIAASLPEWSRDELFVAALPHIQGLDAASLVELCEEADDDGDLCLAAAPRIAAVSATQAATLVRGCDDDADDVAMLYLDKLPSPGVDDVIALANELEYSAKDRLIAKALPALLPIATADLIRIARTSYDDGGDLILEHADAVADLTTANALLLAGELEYSAKDRLLATYLAGSPTLDTDALIAIGRASYGDADEILPAWVTRVSDLSVKNAIRLAGELDYSAKNALLDAFLGHWEKPLSVDQLIDVAEASYARSDEILKDHLFTTTRTTAQVLRIVEELDYSDKNVVLDAYLERRDALSLAELRAIAEASYARQDKILVDEAHRVETLSVAEVVDLADDLDYSDKDELLENEIGRFETLSSSQLVALASAAYGDGVRFSLIEKSLPIVTDLSAKNGVTIAETLDYSKKDEVLADVLELLAQPTAGDVKRLAGAAYQSQKALLLRGLTRMRTVTTDELVTLAEVVDYSAKDAVLLEGLVLVSDLSARGLLRLRETSYQSGDQILDEGQKIIDAR